MPSLFRLFIIYGALFSPFQIDSKSTISSSQRARRRRLPTSYDEDEKISADEWIRSHFEKVFKLKARYQRSGRRMDQEAEADDDGNYAGDDDAAAAADDAQADDAAAADDYYAYGGDDGKQDDDNIFKGDNVCIQFLVEFLEGTTDARDTCEGIMNAYVAARKYYSYLPLPT